MRRRNLLRTIGAVGIGSIAGCTGGTGGGGTEPGTTEGGMQTAEEGTETTAAPAMDYTDGELDVNVSPSVAQDRLEAQYAPVRNHLESHITENYDVPSGFSAKMNIAKNYSVVIQALGSGTSDVAETGPFAAALGVRSDNAEIILQRKGFGTWTYKSIITAPKDSDLENLEDLKSMIESEDEVKIALSDRLSTSGALYPLYNMSQAGIDIGNLPEGSGEEAAFTPVFAGGHTASFEQLANGQVDAAGMGGFVRGLEDDFDSVAKVIDLQEGLPRAPIVVSPELSEEEKGAITQAFLEAPDSIYYGKDGEQDTDDDLWFNDVRKADVEKYQSVIDVAKELGVGTDIFEG